MSNPIRVAAVLFDGFELLDTFGPGEVFGVLRQYEFALVAEHAGPVRSDQGPSVHADWSFEDAPQIDILLVPGGIGTRQQVGNEAMLSFLRSRAESADLVTSVCTGAGLLAAAGLLDGRRATSNKLSWEWVITQGESVEWVPQARWVEDGRFLTSGGVAAGIDMSLAIVSREIGEAGAARLADAIEYEWHRDANWDPFAAKAGLVQA